MIYNNTSRGSARLGTRCTVIKVGYLYCLVRGTIVKQMCIQSITLFTCYLLPSKNNFSNKPVANKQTLMLKFFCRQLWQQVKRNQLFFPEKTTWFWTLSKSLCTAYVLNKIASLCGGAHLNFITGGSIFPPLMSDNLGTKFKCFACLSLWLI